MATLLWSGVSSVGSIFAMKMSSSQLHSIVVFCCNWAKMVKQLSNSPKVAQPSNNVSCPVQSHSCSSNVGICQTIYWVNENMMYGVHQYGTAHQLLMLYVIRQNAFKGLIYSEVSETKYQHQRSRSATAIIMNASGRDRTKVWHMKGCFQQVILLASGRNATDGAIYRQQVVNSLQIRLSITCTQFYQC